MSIKEGNKEGSDLSESPLNGSNGLAVATSSCDKL